MGSPRVDLTYASRIAADLEDEEIVPELRVVLCASALTLAEVTDGTAREAQVRRVAKAVRLEVVTERIGYGAGSLRGQASRRRNRRDLTVDSVLAATALSLPGPTVVLTSDESDLRLLLDGTAVRVDGI